MTKILNTSKMAKCGIRSEECNRCTFLGQSTGGYILPTGVDANGNGLDDAYEPTPREGINPIDTDGDGDSDYLDSDSDDEKSDDASDDTEDSDETSDVPEEDDVLVPPEEPPTDSVPPSPGEEDQVDPDLARYTVDFRDRNHSGM